MIKFIDLPKNFKSEEIQNNPLRQAASTIIDSINILSNVKGSLYYEYEDLITKILEDNLLKKED